MRIRSIHISILVLLVSGLLFSSLQASLAGSAFETAFGEEFTLTETSFDEPWRDLIDSQIFEVDFGDGSVVVRGGHQGEIKHAYASVGTHVVKVRPIDLDPTDGSGTNQPSGPWTEIGRVRVVAAHTPQEATHTADEIPVEELKVNAEATTAASEAPIEEIEEDTLAVEPAPDSQAGLESLLIGGLAMVLGAGFGIYVRRRRDKKDSKR